MQSYMSRRFYRRGCYDVRHNGEKGVSEGRVRVFPCREFFLDKRLHSCIIAPPMWSWEQHDPIPLKRFSESHIALYGDRHLQTDQVAPLLRPRVKRELVRCAVFKLNAHQLI